MAWTWEVEFDFQMLDATGSFFFQDGPGGDGLVFVYQFDDDTAIGGSGGDIGYNGIPYSLAVEWDTYYDGDQGDSNSNHIAIHSKGPSPNTADGSSLLSSINIDERFDDGSVHSAKISYDGTYIDVYHDSVFVIHYPIGKLDKYLNPPHVYSIFGFTAATGAAYETHDILNWKLTVDGSTVAWDYTDFSGDVSAISLLGDASVTSGLLRLNPSALSQVGAAWRTYPHYPDLGRSKFQATLV